MAASFGEMSLAIRVLDERREKDCSTIITDRDYAALIALHAFGNDTQADLRLCINYSHCYTLIAWSME